MTTEKKREDAAPDITDQETLDRGSVEPEELETAVQPPSTRPARTRSADLALRPGQDFGAYRLIRLLGSGGFGQVWEAESHDNGRRLALKILTAAPTASEQEIERFRRESRLAASLSHPNCVYVFSAGEIEGYPIITMELMPGGTLQDRLKQHGALPYREAVDYILQIVAGLEAASASGVIHRDVKPSNCFLDRSGAARVGDFGLSKTLEVDAHLTATGSFLGTPSYSSPEQVRGRDVDFSSDLYSVGATLYALLTGQPPFSGSGGAEVLARILTEPPTPFSEHDVAVPKGLQKVVLRLLAKDKARRFASYAAARTALLPYSSHGLATAGPGRRLLAVLADMLLVNVGLTLIAGSQLVFTPRLQNQLILDAFLWLYFVVLEAGWSRSVGKWGAGLRVTSREGATATLPSLLVRTTLFVLILGLPNIVLISYLGGPAFQSLSVRSPLLSTAVTLLLPIAVLASTMRRSNGWAMLHEWISGTRVVALRVLLAQAASAAAETTRIDSQAGSVRRFGPYRELRPIWESSSSGLLVARDDELGRDVWVHHYRDLESQPSPEELSLSTPGRLQWLQGSREEGAGWDAFEAPAGLGLVEQVRRHGPLPWSTLRRVMHDLALDLASAETLPRLRLSRVLVTVDGRGRRLDFPIVDEPEFAEAAGDWREFFHQLLLFGLEGRLTPETEIDGRLPRAPLPEHARGLVERLCRREGTNAFGTPGMLAQELAEDLARPARATRGMRLAPLLLTVAPPLFLAAMATLTILGVGDSPTLSRTLAQCRSAWDKVDGLPEQEREAVRRAIGVTQAAAYARLLELSAQREGGLDYSTAVGTLGSLPPEQEQQLEASLREHGSASDEERAEARRRVDELAPLPGVLEVVLAVMLLVLAFMSIPALLLTLVLGNPPLLSLFGLSVQRGDGQPAGRLRCLLRGAIIWGPLVAMYYWDPWYVVQIIFPALLLIGIASLVRRPERGISELASGTRLVPR